MSPFAFGSGLGGGLGAGPHRPTRPAHPPHRGNICDCRRPFPLSPVAPHPVPIAAAVRGIHPRLHSLSLLLTPDSRPPGPSNGPIWAFVGHEPHRHLPHRARRGARFPPRQERLREAEGEEESWFVDALGSRVGAFVGLSLSVSSLPLFLSVHVRGMHTHIHLHGCRNSAGRWPSPRARSPPYGRGRDAVVPITNHPRRHPIDLAVDLAVDVTELQPES